MDRIHGYVANNTNISLPTDTTIRPFIQLAFYDRANLRYVMIEQSKLYLPSFVGGTTIPPYNLRSSFIQNLNLFLPEGTILTVFVGLESENLTMSFLEVFAVGGGLYFENQEL